MTSFEDFIEELRAGAEREGLEALAEFDLFESYFRELAGIVAGLRAVQRGETHELKLLPTFGPED